LISNEQFAIGGADSVRGYLESNSLGDQGLFGTVEVRTPPLMKYLPGADASEFYARAFYDAGHTSIQSPLPAQTRSFNLASVGFGIFLKKWYGVSTTLDYAYALHTAGFVSKGDDRLHFRISYDW
jgi:hemolysin activation/secretion protein